MDHLNPLGPHARGKTGSRKRGESMKAPLPEFKFPPGERVAEAHPLAQVSPPELARQRPKRLGAFQRLVPLAEPQEQGGKAADPTARTDKSPSPRFPIFDYSTSHSTISSPSKSEAQTSVEPKDNDWAKDSELEPLLNRDEPQAKADANHKQQPTIPSTLPFPLISLPEAQRRMRESRKSAPDLEQSRPPTAVAWTSKPLPSVPLAPSPDNLPEKLQAECPWLAIKMQTIEFDLVALRQQREDIKQMLKMDEPIRMAALKRLDRQIREDFQSKNTLSVVPIRTVASIMPEKCCDGAVTPPVSPASTIRADDVLVASSSSAALLKEDEEEEWEELERQIEETHTNVRRATVVLERMKSHFPAIGEAVDAETGEQIIFQDGVDGENQG
ncbi:hypothetical protein B0T16DRAFT_449517 [Cercophora newfieldiana]|uniref:Uncharacterized protein n=1 Tax=Cercophora newfieldiana TaxID=92897 RepID=A0AA40CHE2_9PEZI|nr:hypothetical protein B0T16DRAFT_449517 [Cercophora newfieldiana]